MTTKHPLLIVRRAPWLLVAIHIPFIIEPAVFSITGLEIGPGNPFLAIGAALVAGAVQLRHSFAGARGGRPAGWRWTFLLLLAAVYGPMPFLLWNWTPIQSFVVVSAALLLRGRLRVVAIVVPIVATSIAAGLTVAFYDHESADAIIVSIVFWLLLLPLSGGALLGAVRMVRVVDEMYEARTELAEVAISRERVRVSRDLHDLLGQSLSAVSLKGDLAIKLLPHDTAGARAELESLTELARTALRDVRAVARDEHAVSLRAEIDAAGALLAAAGIEARIDVDLPPLAGPVQDVLAWAVREGTTNLLRHSEANTASITVDRRGGVVRMEIINDGVREPAGTGTGIAGVVERARAVSGSASAESIRDGRFRLTVAVPEVAA